VQLRSIRDTESAAVQCGTHGCYICQSVGKIPDEWRSAVVTPLYKGGSSSAVSNYRPVSLTCAACKIMERIIAIEMLSYLRVHDVMSKQQHGFLY